MIESCEAELICDLAEVYHVYDYKQMPVIFIATLAAGLREDARVWHKLEDDNPFFTDQRRLLVSMYDLLNVIRWLQTTDGANGTNYPDSLYQKLYHTAPEKEIRRFQTSKDFKREWELTIRRLEHGNTR